MFDVWYFQERKQKICQRFNRHCLYRHQKGTVLLFIITERQVLQAGIYQVPVL